MENLFWKTILIWLIQWQFYAKCAYVKKQCTTDRMSTCRLIVEYVLCNREDYYIEFCCVSCLKSGQIDIQTYMKIPPIVYDEKYNLKNISIIKEGLFEIIPTNSEKLPKTQLQELKAGVSSNSVFVEKSSFDSSYIVLAIVGILFIVVAMIGLFVWRIRRSRRRRANSSIRSSNSSFETTEEPLISKPTSALMPLFISTTNGGGKNENNISNSNNINAKDKNTSMKKSNSNDSLNSMDLGTRLNSDNLWRMPSSASSSNGSSGHIIKNKNFILNNDIYYMIPSNKEEDFTSQLTIKSFCPTS